MARIVISDLSGPCGQDIARYFLKKGDEVAGSNRGTALPDDLAGIAAFDCDITTEEGCAAFAAELDGRADALVLTGRQMEKSSAIEGPPEVFERVMSVNAKAAFFMCKHVGGLLTAKGRGAIVFVGSIHGEKPTGAAFAFSVSMGAIKMLHREASLQMGRAGVHCVLLEMGPVAGDDIVMDTPLSPIYDGFELSIPRKRACTFAELAPLVDMAIQNPMLNGADIRADAGFMLKYGDR